MYTQKNFRSKKELKIASGQMPKTSGVKMTDLQIEYMYKLCGALDVLHSARTYLRSHSGNLAPINMPAFSLLLEATRKVRVSLELLNRF
jgi:hypothetical protein